LVDHPDNEASMTIFVSRIPSLPMAQTVQIRTHSFVADTAIDGGGSDAGPSPHDLYDAALASCKALTVTWYANKKGLPLTDVRVECERDATEDHAPALGRRPVGCATRGVVCGGSEMPDPQADEQRDDGHYDHAGRPLRPPYASVFILHWQRRSSDLRFA
jgi:hypothetical protein